jgi:tetratricopeptide (TPR) repeat protein
LQDAVSSHLANALLGTRGESAAVVNVALPPTKNAAAYEMFLRARERMSRSARWDLRTAIEMLEEAVRMDPRFADAWASLAEACLSMAVGYEPGPAWIRVAERAIRRAVSLDPRNAEAQAARGRLCWSPLKRFQNRAALRAFRTALRINPGCTTAWHWQGIILQHVGLFDEARESARFALATDPDNAFILSGSILTEAYSGNYELAEEYAARAISADPAGIFVNALSQSHLLMAGQLERAAARIESVSQKFPGDSSVLASESLLWALRGEKRKAGVSLAKALRPGGKTMLHSHHMWHTAAAAYAVLGKPAPAISLLRKCIALGLPNYPAFRDDPHLQSLHNHGPFIRMMDGLKREWKEYRREFGRVTDGPSP